MQFTKHILLGVLLIAGTLLGWKARSIDYDMDKIRNTRLEWNNQLRSEMKLEHYEIDQKLNETATTWSSYMGDIWYWTHKRTNKDGFYNYNSIKNRFGKQWVSFHGKGTQFTENVGIWYIKCKDHDCTDEIISAIKTTWNFYMSEKNRKYTSQKLHYLSLISKYYDKIWVGIDIVWNKYYLTIHYSTDDISYQEQYKEQELKIASNDIR